MNLENIPNNLRHLVNLVQEWGINDDGYRDQNIEEASTESLLYFIESISRQDLELLNTFLSDEIEIFKSTAEYINYTCFLMAYDFSRAVLKSRNIPLQEF